MNVINASKILSDQLVSYTGQPQQAAQINEFIAGATLQYSRFRPFERRYGEGALTQDALTGATTFTAVGGPFVAGATVVIDAYTPYAETCVISSISRIAPASNTDLTGSPVTLNLSAPTANPHYAGISPIFNANMGLTLVSGVSNYIMPLDFIRVNQRSFDRARGLFPPSESTMYARTYVQSQILQPTGWGISQPFLGEGWGIPNGFLGIPSLGNNNFNLVGFPGQVWQFQGTSPVYLNIYPAPQSAVTLYFTYRAVQQPETIPDQDMDAVVAYARYLGLVYNANWVSSAPDLRDIRQDVKYSAAGKNLLDLAMMSKKEFDQKIVQRPFAVTG